MQRRILAPTIAAVTVFVALAGCSRGYDLPPRKPVPTAPAIDPESVSALKAMRLTLPELRVLMAKSPHVVAPFLTQEYVARCYQRGQTDVGQYLATEWVSVDRNLLELLIASPGSMSEHELHSALDLLAGESPRGVRGISTDVHEIVRRDWVLVVEWLVEQNPDPAIFNWEDERTGRLPLNDALSPKMAELLEGLGAQRRSEAELAEFARKREEMTQELIEDGRRQRAEREREEERERAIDRDLRQWSAEQTEASRRAGAAHEKDWYERKLAEARDPNGGLPNVTAGTPPAPDASGEAKPSDPKKPGDEFKDAAAEKKPQAGASKDTPSPPAPSAPEKSAQKPRGGGSSGSGGGSAPPAPKERKPRETFDTRYFDIGESGWYERSIAESQAWHGRHNTAVQLCLEQNGTFNPAKYKLEGFLKCRSREVVVGGPSTEYKCRYEQVIAICHR